MPLLIFGLKTDMQTANPKFQTQQSPERPRRMRHPAVEPARKTRDKQKKLLRVARRHVVRRHGPRFHSRGLLSSIFASLWPAHMSEKEALPASVTCLQPASLALQPCAVLQASLRSPPTASNSSSCACMSEKSGAVPGKHCPCTTA